MIVPFSLALVIVLHAIALVRGGIYELLGFFWVWSLGMFGVSTMIARVGRPRPGADQVNTVTGNGDMDFALAAVWPIGFWIVFGYFVLRKLNRRVR